MRKIVNMDMQTILLVILIGLAAGMLGGLVGVGGGLIIVPSLIYFLGMSQLTAQGTSLGMILLPVGLFGVLYYYKGGYVDLKIAGILAIGFLVGSYFGSKIALSLSQQTVKRIFAIFMILVAIKMLWFDKEPTEPKSAASIVNKK
ncbi:hypothetical protein BH11BAC3_BH11BAC3_41850 [soil metagenome]